METTGFEPARKSDKYAVNWLCVSPFVTRKKKYTPGAVWFPGFCIAKATAYALC